MNAPSSSWPWILIRLRGVCLSYKAKKDFTIEGVIFPTLGVFITNALLISVSIDICFLFECGFQLVKKGNFWSNFITVSLLFIHIFAGMLSGVEWSHGVGWNLYNKPGKKERKSILNMHNLCSVSGMGVKVFCQNLNYCNIKDQLKGQQLDWLVYSGFMFGSQRLHYIGDSHIHGCLFGDCIGDPLTLPSQARYWQI